MKILFLVTVMFEQVMS